MSEHSVEKDAPYRPIATHWCGQTQPHAAHAWTTPPVYGTAILIQTYQCGGYVFPPGKGATPTNERAEDGVCWRHVPTVDSVVCSTHQVPWPCPVAVAWEQAHDVFCPRGQVCSTHLRPGDRYVNQHVMPPGKGGDAA